MQIGLGDLRRIISESAGVSESVDLDGDILDVSFVDLGYDSVALLEITSTVMRQYRIELGEDAERAATPREFLTLANAQLQLA